jgi:hypothetical protein
MAEKLSNRARELSVIDLIAQHSVEMNYPKIELPFKLYEVI